MSLGTTISWTTASETSTPPTSVPSDTDSDISNDTVISTESEIRWRRRALFGREDNPPTLWDDLGSLWYMDARWVDTGSDDEGVLEGGMEIWQPDDWAAAVGWRPLVLLGADDEGAQRRSVMIHRIWHPSPPFTSTPESVQELDEVTGSTELEQLAPAIGHVRFHAVPGLETYALAELDSEPHSMQWEGLCFHRIDYGACGRDVVRFEERLAEMLLGCPNGGTVWEALGRGRKWTWLVEAHQRRDQLRAEQT